ncbi:dTDP-glucose 4,6-dehydratase [Sulfobacillus thermosulfidooxidans DSM 9293]|uniref:dTDP-glucose 4,6-dehydratase n=2 Tax=Sulfobacillus thermosulfidooxidans TaxID=28034 RepID=A0A1W1WJ12_SULTA|nr:dTDP-glucose 4,6-dehydratase [Sulfobacillus thermosulfidooxidans DSM 9293]
MMKPSDLIGQPKIDKEEATAMRVMITGGLGFIGSQMVRYLLETVPDIHIINVDALTYAGNLENLKDYENDPRYEWVHASIGDQATLDRVLAENPVDVIINFAAESHVDRSILSAAPFVTTNVLGTQVLLELARTHHVPRFLQVSTDEVYGSLPLGGSNWFSETSPLTPNSPYAASKAAADFLCLAAFRTYGQDVVITRCSNNYGPYQFPEKLIPLFITNGLEGKTWPLYGDGQNVRDWLHVSDHVRALWMVALQGKSGQIYNIGGHNEKSNREVAEALADILHLPYSVITPVADRLGHDRRYAIDSQKITKELGWHPLVDWEQGLRDTVQWYKDHEAWWKAIKTGAYLEYYQQQYGPLRKDSPSA